MSGKRTYEPRPKAQKAAKAKKGGQARPNEPLREVCEICNQRRATCRHHKLRRSQGGGDEEANTLDLCDGPGSCHERIHHNPAWAYALGYLIRRGA